MSDSVTTDEQIEGANNMGTTAEDDDAAVEFLNSFDTVIENLEELSELEDLSQRSPRLRALAGQVRNLREVYRAEHDNGRRLSALLDEGLSIAEQRNR